MNQPRPVRLGWRASRDGPLRTARLQRITGLRRRVRGVRRLGMTVTASEASRMAIGRPGKTHKSSARTRNVVAGTTWPKDARGSEWNKADDSMKDAPARGHHIGLPRSETVTQQNGTLHGDSYPAKEHPRNSPRVSQNNPAGSSIELQDRPGLKLTE